MAHSLLSSTFDATMVIIANWAPLIRAVACVVIGIAIATLFQRGSKKAAKEIPAFTSERSEFDVTKVEVESKELAEKPRSGHDLQSSETRSWPGKIYFNV